MSRDRGVQDTVPADARRRAGRLLVVVGALATVLVLVLAAGVGVTSREQRGATYPERVDSPFPLRKGAVGDGPATAVVLVPTDTINALVEGYFTQGLLYPDGRVRTLPQLGSGARLSPEGRYVLTIPVEGYPPGTRMPDGDPPASSVRDTERARFVVLDLVNGGSQEVAVPAPVGTTIVADDSSRAFWAPDSSRAAAPVCVSERERDMWASCPVAKRVALVERLEPGGGHGRPTTVAVDGELVGWHDATTLVTLSASPEELRSAVPLQVRLVDAATGEVKRSHTFTLPYRDHADRSGGYPGSFSGGNVSVSPTGRLLGLRLDNFDRDGPQWVFTVDLASGALTDVGEVPNRWDMGSAELLWRGDEPLVGLSDQVVPAADPRSRPLVAIHPMIDLRPDSWAANAFSGQAHESVLGTQAPWPLWFWRTLLVAAAITGLVLWRIAWVRRRRRELGLG